MVPKKLGAVPRIGHFQKGKFTQLKKKQKRFNSFLEEKIRHQVVVIHSDIPGSH